MDLTVADYRAWRIWPSCPGTHAWMGYSNPSPMLLQVTPISSLCCLTVLCGILSPVCCQCPEWDKQVCFFMSSKSRHATNGYKVPQRHFFVDITFFYSKLLCDFYLERCEQTLTHPRQDTGDRSNSGVYQGLAWQTNELITGLLT